MASGCVKCRVTAAFRCLEMRPSIPKCVSHALAKIEPLRVTLKKREGRYDIVVTDARKMSTDTLSTARHNVDTHNVDSASL